MIFSLGLLESIFGEVDFKTFCKICSDVRKIKKAYRRKNGMIKSLKMTNRKILEAFFYYDAWNYDEFEEYSIKHWEDFVQKHTQECNVNLLEWNI